MTYNQEWQIEPPFMLDNAPLEPEERDMIAIHLGMSPNSEVIRNRVEVFTPVFNVKARTILYYLDEITKLRVRAFTNRSDVVQVEDIKFLINNNGVSLDAMFDKYLQDLSRLVNLPIIQSQNSVIAGSVSFL